ncbi:MAG TPA: hypothetical protein VM146_11865 [Steroidobacteraceae bacterium]|nr:hypothetical protein [Steroidobacteraceae bacterium]
MRLGLVILLSLLMTGCAIWRKDKEEPVEKRSEREKAEPVLKPSEALKPEKNDIASPISDRFYIRGIAFQGAVNTQMRIDSTGSVIPDGTLLSAEDDLGLDDTIEQARMEFDVRLGERNHVRIDYFKLDRFGQVILPADIDFGDFSFDAGDTFRSKLDWRALSLTYTYSLFKAERFEAGLGLGLHIFEMHAEGGEPGTLNRDRGEEAGAFPTLALNAAYRISKRWAVTARYNTLRVDVDDGTGEYIDAHADIQYRWRKNFAVGIGYSNMSIDLDLQDVDEPLFFNLDTKGPEIFFRAAF